jgi:hypothetical protein
VTADAPVRCRGAPPPAAARARTPPPGLAAQVGPAISFARVDLSACARANGTAADAGGRPDHEAGQEYPASSYLGRRPGYGVFVRHATGVSFDALRLGWAAGSADGRPAVVVEAAQQVSFSRLSARRDAATGSTYDVGLRGGAEGTVVRDSPGVVVRDLP